MACLWWKKNFTKQEKLSPSPKGALTSNYSIKGKSSVKQLFGARVYSLYGTLSFSMNIMRDTGYIEYWHELNLNKINKCTASHSSNRAKGSPRLRLSDLVGAFVLWLCGVSLSVLVFLFEKFLWWSLLRCQHIRRAFIKTGQKINHPQESSPLEWTYVCHTLSSGVIIFHAAHKYAVVCPKPWKIQMVGIINVIAKFSDL